MTQREDLLGRLTELDAGQEAHRATARSIQKMINHGDYAGAATALDALETALHPALAAGGGGGAGPLVGAYVSSSGFSDVTNNTAFNQVDYDPEGLWDAGNHRFDVPSEHAGLYLVQGLMWFISVGATYAAIDVQFQPDWGESEYLIPMSPLPYEGANNWAGSFAFTAPLGTSGHLCFLGLAYDGGTAEVVQGGPFFSLFRLGDLA